MVEFNEWLVFEVFEGLQQSSAVSTCRMNGGRHTRSNLLHSKHGIDPA
jgi:hypothetical protein